MGVTSKFEYFYGFFALKIRLFVIFYNKCACFFFFFFFFLGGGGVLEMPDILGGTEQMLGPSLYAYKQMFRVSPPGLQGRRENNNKKNNLGNYFFLFFFLAN